MIKHIVFFTLKNEAEGCSKIENAQKMKNQLEALKSQIPGIIELEVGFDFSKTPQSADVCLYSTFESKEALDNYQVHPLHQEVVKFVKNVISSRIIADYEA